MHPHNFCPHCKKELTDLEAYEVLFKALSKALRKSAQETLEALQKRGVKLVKEK